jgi:hypothetical protein
MKTKILYRFAMASVIAGTVFVACSKSSSTADNGNSSSDLQVQSDDQARVSDATDNVEDDANAAMGAEDAVSGASTQTVGHGQGRIIEGVQGVNTLPVCDAAITVDSGSNPRTITLTYNGNASCNATQTRTGVVVISIPSGTKWRDSGAVVTVSFQALKITSTIDNKSITINGTHTYTNTSGGSLLALYEGVVKSITHTITSSNMSVTFDNSSQRVWSVARQRLFTFNSQTQDLTIATSGTHTDGSTSGISEWGTNRFGNSFETVITSPVKIESGCQWRITSGQVEVLRPDVTTTVTFGLNSGGNTVLSCPSGAYYFKLVWSAANKDYTFILPY